MLGLSMRRILILLFLGLVGGSGYYYLADLQRFPIHTIKISASLQNLTGEDIQDTVEKYLHANYFFCRTQQMTASLKEHPWIENAEVRRVWPGTLKIIVTEKLPIAWWNDLLITGEGETIAPREGKKYGLPRLMGPAAQKREVLQIYQNVSKILSDYRLSIDALIWRNNQALDLVLTNGIQLNLGKQAIETRITRFCRAYSTVFAEKKAQLTRVDLRYPRGMAVQWSK